MDVNAAKRLGQHLAANREIIAENWATNVRETLRGRLTKAELDRQIEEISNALIACLEAGATTPSAPEASELLAVLADLSRTRARHGFTATETAVSVFGVKEAALRTFPADDVQGLADHMELLLFVDKLGLYTFEVFVNARDAIITEQSEQLMELSTPVVKLWDGVVAVPLIGTLDSARS